MTKKEALDILNKYEINFPEHFIFIKKTVVLKITDFLIRNSSKASFELKFLKRAPFIIARDYNNGKIIKHLCRHIPFESLPEEDTIHLNIINIDSPKSVIN